MEKKSENLKWLPVGHFSFEFNVKASLFINNARKLFYYYYYYCYLRYQPRLINEWTEDGPTDQVITPLEKTWSLDILWQYHSVESRVLSEMWPQKPQSPAPSFRAQTTLLLPLTSTDKNNPTKTY